MPPPRVSVIVPAYNAERWIARTLESVCAQTLDAWEVVVVDDGSTDGTAGTVRAIAEREPRVRMVQQRNAGLCGARNAGFAASSPDSEYVWFLDADDMLDPEALEVMTGYLDAHRDVVMAYCGVLLIDTADQPLPRPEGNADTYPRFAPSGIIWATRIPETQPETPLSSLIAYHSAIPSSSLMRRSAFVRTQRWRRGNFVEDKDMVLQLAMLGPIHLVPRRLVRYRRHDANITNAPNWAALHELHEAWWAGDGLTAGQRHSVREAMVFQHRLNAFFQLRSARSELVRGHPAVAARQLLRAVRNLTTLLRKRAQLGIGRATDRAQAIRSR